MSTIDSQLTSQASDAESNVRLDLLISCIARDVLKSHVTSPGEFQQPFEIWSATHLRPYQDVALVVDRATFGD